MNVPILNNKTENPYAAMMKRRQPESTLSQNSDVKAKLRMLSNDRQSVYDGFSSSKSGNLLINATLDYGKSVRAKRQQEKDSLLSIKTVKYQFKNISSQIIRAKTSSAARQAVGRAEREVLRLKREKTKDGVDETEINAAISHAKAMERAARRKVKHLVQEEMAKASMGNGVLLDEEVVESDFAEGKNPEENPVGSPIDSMDCDGATKLSEGMSEEMPDELPNEMLDEMLDGMEEVLEETGLEELNDVLAVDVSDMEPEDLKMLKIKHRNSEMKEIVKADSEFLKTMFDHFEQMIDVAL